MKYQELSNFFELVEKTTRRLEMTAYLVELLKRTPPGEVDKVIYLMQGKLAPDYEGVELGVADRLTLRAISIASGLPISELDKTYKRVGDIGLVAEQALSKSKHKSIVDFFGTEVKKKLTVERVYETLLKIARATGEGGCGLHPERRAAPTG